MENIIDKKLIFSDHYWPVCLMTGGGASIVSITPASTRGVYDHSFNTLALYDNLNSKFIRPVNEQYHNLTF